MTQPIAENMSVTRTAVRSLNVTRALRALALAFALPLVLTACGSQNSTLIVTSTLAFDQTCQCIPPLGGLVLNVRTSGTYDVVFRRPYETCVAVQNLIFNQEIGQQQTSTTFGLNSNTRDIITDYAEVRIIAQPTSAFDLDIGTYRVILNAQVIPARPQPSTQVADARTLIFDLIPVEILDEIASLEPNVSTSGGEVDVVVETVIVGHLRTGRTIKSDVYRFPITLCNGCRNLIPTAGCPADSVVRGEPLVGVGGGTCTPGQDNEALTCACPTGKTVYRNDPNFPQGICLTQEEIQSRDNANADDDDAGGGGI